MGLLPLARRLSVLFWLGGCSAGSGDCEAIRAATERETCRFEAVKAAGSDQAAVDLALSAIPEGDARDLVRLRMAIDRPAEGERWCSGVTTALAQEKCQQVLGRPHLRSGP